MRTLEYAMARAALLAVMSVVWAAMKARYVGCLEDRFGWAFSAPQARSRSLAGAGPWTSPFRESTADHEPYGRCINARCSRCPRSSLVRGRYSLSRKPTGRIQLLELGPRQAIAIDPTTDQEENHDRCTDS